MSDKSQEALGRIEGLLELMVPMIRANEDRIQKVEKTVARHTGVLATISTLFTAAIAVITDW